MLGKVRSVYGLDSDTGTRGSLIQVSGIMSDTEASLINGVGSGLGCHVHVEPDRQGWDWPRVVSGQS